jgi:hypothetical protein
MPDPGDTGYGDRGQGTKSSTGTTSKSGSGNTSGVGGGGGGGGGATGSRGSSTGNVGSGNGTNVGGNVGGQQSSSDRDGGMRAGVGQGGGGNAPSGSNTGGQKSSSDQGGGKPSQVGGTNNSGLGSQKSSTPNSSTPTRSSSDKTGSSVTGNKVGTTKTTTASPKGPAASQAASKANQNLVSPTRSLKTTTSDPYANSRRGPTGPSGEASQTTTTLRTPLGEPQEAPSAEQAQNKYSNLVKPDIGLRGPLGPDGSFSNENQFANPPVRQDFQLTDLANRMAAAGRPMTPEQMQMAARTIAGEAIGETDEAQSATFQSMVNRLGLGLAEPQKFPHFGSGDVNDMFSGYDANGLDYGVRKGVPQGGNPVFQSATPGSSAIDAGIAAIANQINPESPYNIHAPEAVKNATHYYNPKDATPKWASEPSFQDTATPYGAHVFGNAEPTAQKVAALRGGEGLTQVASADPTRLSTVPDPTGSVYDTAGLTRPTTVDPTRVSSLNDTFAPTVGPAKNQDRIPATEPSYFNDIANRYISPPTPTAAPPRDPVDQAPDPTGTWDKEIEAAMGQPYGNFTAPIAPAQGQPYAGFKAPPAEDIFSGANSIYALPDTIPGFADQGRRLSIPGSYPALAAPDNLPAQGQPYAAFNPPAASAGMSYTPQLASLANALGVDVPTAKQIVDRISITGPENLVATTANWGPESVAMMTTGLIDPYRDPWAQQGQLPPAEQARRAQQVYPHTIASPEDIANMPQANPTVTYDPMGNPYMYGPTDGGFLPDGSFVNGPLDPASLDTPNNQAATDRMANYRRRNDVVGVDEINPEPVSEDERLAEQAAEDEKAQPVPDKYPEGTYPKAPVNLPGKVATGATNAVVPGLGPVLNLVGADDRINDVINRLINAPRSGTGTAMQRMQDNAANRSSSDNQAAQQQAAQALQTYYDMLYSGLIPDDGTLGNGGTPTPDAITADQLALLYETFA